MSEPAFRPIDWQTIRDTLWQWCVDVSGCETIWTDRVSPQPAYPYASLTILPGVLNYAAVDEERIQADGSLALVGPRDFVLSCQVHIGPDAEAACDARTRADALVASLAIPQHRNALTGANLGIRERGQVQTLDLFVGAERIRRTQVDVRFGTMSYVLVPDWPNLAEVGWFDSVEATAAIDGAPTNIQWDEELLDPNA